MKDVAMYTKSQLFGEKTTGGLKRFLELYKGLITHGIKLIYTADSPDILNKYNVSAFSIKVWVNLILFLFLQNLKY